MNVSAVGGGSFYQAASNLKPPSKEQMEARFAELDSDGDGGLSLEESGLSEDKFTLMDYDGDGILTEADREAQMAEGGGQSPEMKGQDPGPMGPPPDFAELIESQDSDGGGALSETESGLSTEQFASLDTNHDGVVTQDELEASRESMQPPPPPPPSDDDESADSSETSTGYNFITNQAMAAYQAQSDMNLFSMLMGAGSQGSFNMTA